MIKPGSLVTVNFPGATGMKRRPAVVVSTSLYHSDRPDVILAAVTSQVANAKSKTDYVLQDWSAAGLKQMSAVRIFLGTRPVTDILTIGELSERDWTEVQKRLRISIEV